MRRRRSRGRDSDSDRDSARGQRVRARESRDSSCSAGRAAPCVFSRAMSQLSHHPGGSPPWELGPSSPRKEERRGMKAPGWLRAAPGIPRSHPAQVGNHFKTRPSAGHGPGSKSGGDSAVTSPRPPASPVSPRAPLPVPGAPRPPLPVPRGSPGAGAAHPGQVAADGAEEGREDGMGGREGVKISSEIRAAFLADQSPARRLRGRAR